MLRTAAVGACVDVPFFQQFDHGVYLKFIVVLSCFLITLCGKRNDNFVEVGCSCRSWLFITGKSSVCAGNVPSNSPAASFGPH